MKSASEITPLLKEETPPETLANSISLGAKQPLQDQAVIDIKPVTINGNDRCRALVVAIAATAVVCITFIVSYEEAPETTDPSDKLFIIALFICIALLLALPFAVTASRNYTAAKQREANRREMGDSQDDGLLRSCKTILYCLVDSLAMWQQAHHEIHVSNGVLHEVRELICIPQNISIENNSGSGISDECCKTKPTVQKQNITNKKSSTTRVGTIQSSIEYTLELAKYDAESKRIIRLAVPFMANNLTKSIAELAVLAIVSQTLGTDSMIAFSMVEVMVGITSSFMRGWIEMINSLGAMAEGAENYELVGQYVQSAILLYATCQVPIAFIWGFSMHLIILLFGFNETTADIAKDYVWVYMANEIAFGVLEAFIYFLGIIDREKLGMMFSCSCDLSKVVLVSVVLNTDRNASLPIVGLTTLANTCLFLFLTILVSSWKQLFRPYKYGMIGTYSFGNKDVVTAAIKTGLPLAMGGLLAYAEWGIFTVLAAVIGPNEAAAWAILGYVWQIFEATTEAIGEASEVRCAYQLGKGRPEAAKLSAYKSMLLSIVVALITTAIFFMLDESLPVWLTTDETIQDLLADLFPLMSLGNITMTVGMGRYQLATTINFTTCLLVTVPLGVAMTIWLHMDLQGLAFSIVMGYVLCQWIMVIILLASGWDKISRGIRERVANGDLDIESCSTDSSDLYDDYYWDELPDNIRDAAELLGYKRYLWDHDIAPHDTEKSWYELTPEQKEAAKVLGYNSEKWNDDESATCVIESYDEIEPEHK